MEEVTAELVGGPNDGDLLRIPRAWTLHLRMPVPEPPSVFQPMQPTPRPTRVARYGLHERHAAGFEDGSLEILMVRLRFEGME